MKQTIVIIVLLLLLGWAGNTILSQQKQLKAKDNYISEVNKAMNKADKVIYKIREVVKNEEVDCYNDTIPESITSLH